MYNLYTTGKIDFGSIVRCDGMYRLVRKLYFLINVRMTQSIMM